MAIVAHHVDIQLYRTLFICDLGINRLGRENYTLQ